MLGVGVAATNQRDSPGAADFRSYLSHEHCF